MAAERTRLVRVDLATDQLISDTARLQGRSKKDVVASAIGTYVSANREDLDRALDRAAYRFEPRHASTPKSTSVGWDSRGGRRMPPSTAPLKVP